MLDLPINVRQELVDLVPASILPNVSCFSFNSNHTKYNLIFDIVVCTRNGEITEFYQRKPVLSLYLNKLQLAIDITLYKKEDELHYLVTTVDELLILTRTNVIKLCKVIQNLGKFTIDDSPCLGIAKIKVWFKGDAMPVVLDDKFNTESDTTSPELFEACDEDELPALNKHKCKIIEAKYVVSQSEKNLNDIKQLRKNATYVLYSKMYPQLENVMFKKPLKEIFLVLRKQVGRIGIKLCNKKIIVIHHILNDSNELLTDIEVILHCKDKAVIEYTTKLYISDSNIPYWQEKNKSVILPREKVNVVTLIDIKELENLSTNIIEFHGLILYNIHENVQLLPLDPILVTQRDIMNEKLDILSLKSFGEHDLLSVLASSIKTDLVLTDYVDNEQCSGPLCDILCQYLGMIRVNEETNMVIHRSSPYHPLNGVMVVCEFRNSNDGRINITVYSRCQSQVIALLHQIYDAVPHRIIITLPRMLVSKNSVKLEENNQQNYVEFGACLREQMSLILKYYDDCILKMGQSNNQNVLNMLGDKIDLLIGGENNFELFVNKLKDEIVKGIDLLNGNVAKKDNDIEVMIIDD